MFLEKNREILTIMRVLYKVYIQKQKILYFLFLLTCSVCLIAQLMCFLNVLNQDAAKLQNPEKLYYSLIRFQEKIGYGMPEWDSANQKMASQ